ncbi:MAG: AMP-dependent synthetase and ligase [Nocardioides sp.]|nr:AMP-dependent synthetase and ligase [Nocardioides sp.]
MVSSLAGWLADPVEPGPLVIETSGSTGAPKRVVLARSAVLASVHATERRLQGSGQWLLALPASYVAGVQVICRSLVAGHEPVLLEEHGSFAEAVAAMAATGSTDRETNRFVSLVPTQLHRMLDTPADLGALRAFRTVLLGGGPIDPSLRARADEAGVRVVATYGSAETAGGCVYDGYPLDGVALATDPGGRLRISGPTLFEGYDGDPALTAEVLVDGWFLTSDAARLDEDGRLQVLGRIDDVVVSGGVNVPTPAVADRLREHPDVHAVEVLGVPDDEWGTRVVAFVVGELTLDRARTWVAEKHPRSWAPRDLVRLDEIPMLDNGKPDRLRLRTLA